MPNTIEKCLHNSFYTLWERPAERIYISEGESDFDTSYS